MLSNYLFRLASFLGGSAVILGAMNAHLFKDKLSLYQTDIIETGVFYQFIHSLALLLCVSIVIFFNKNGANRYLLFSGVMFFLGILFFSGSLYLLAFTELSIFGPITPIGGMLLILGWISLLFCPLKDISYIKKDK